MGLSVHVEVEAEGKSVVPLETLKEMVAELGVQQLLVRIPMADIDNLETYIEHIDGLKEGGREVIVNLLQCRDALENPEQQEQGLREILTALKGRVDYLQVGNAYNRRKWAFNGFNDYVAFFKMVRTVSSEVSPEIQLLGGSVIDFEIPSLLESLFHLRPIKYDGYASQLYVDRRGAPENKQMGFNFFAKIQFISLLNKLSGKSEGGLWITEFNWPLKGTRPFAPCKGEVLVDEQSQADFLTRSYLIAMASGRVRTCYWHQLVAPGYGLVDNREQPARKRPSYYAFSTLVKLFSSARNLTYSEKSYKGVKGVSALQAETTYKGENVNLIALWCNQEEPLPNPEKADLWLDQEGNQLISEHPPSEVTGRVIYGMTTVG